MTPEKFKKVYPEYSHLEGEQLLNTMENVYLWTKLRAKKKYQLRWLLYRNKPNFGFGKNNFTATERCSKCKKGVAYWMTYMWGDKIISKCPHCREDLTREKNTSLVHFLWKKKEIFWNLLDFLHLCRNTVGGRYEMGNEESYFVESQEFDEDWNHIKTNFRKRKWWEYIIIEKPHRL